MKNWWLILIIAWWVIGMVHAQPISGSINAENQVQENEDDSLFIITSNATYKAMTNGRLISFEDAIALYNVPGAMDVNDTVPQYYSLSLQGKIEATGALFRIEFNNQADCKANQTYKITHGNSEVSGFYWIGNTEQTFVFESGSLTITAFDQKTISGTFNVNARSYEGQWMTITNGVFEKLPLVDAKVFLKLKKKN